MQELKAGERNEDELIERIVEILNERMNVQASGWEINIWCNKTRRTRPIRLSLMRIKTKNTIIRNKMKLKDSNYILIMIYRSD